MRFITEFEFKHAHSSGDIENRRKHYSILLGEKVAEVFGWQTEGAHSKLEIEAFPMDKWIEFKNKLNMHLHSLDVDLVPILHMIKDLDFYSNNKQAVDKLTNLSDQMEYRGPNSHCKACEDEAAGIKHIQAQKHTCRKRKQ